MERNKYWNLSQTLFISFIVLLFFSLIQSLVLIFLQPKGFTSSINSNTSFAFSNLGLISSISSMIGIAIICVFIKIKKTSLNDYLNFKIPSVKHTLLFLLLSFTLMFIMEWLTNFKPTIFETDFVIDSYKQAKSLPLLYIGVVFLAPLFEEILFRGFLFKGLRNSFLGGHGTVLTTSLIFSIIHLTQYSISIIFLMILPMALLLGYARLYSKSLLLPFFLHAINNLITCVITHFEVY